MSLGVVKGGKMKIRKTILISLCVLLVSALGVTASAKYIEVYTNTGTYYERLEGQAGILKGMTTQDKHISQVTPKSTSYISFTVSAYDLHNTNKLYGEKIVNRVGNANITYSASVVRKGVVYTSQHTAGIFASSSPQSMVVDKLIVRNAWPGSH